MQNNDVLLKADEAVTIRVQPLGNVFRRYFKNTEQAIPCYESADRIALHTTYFARRKDSTVDLPALKRGFFCGSMS